jgi:hypothetical protein
VHRLVLGIILSLPVGVQAATYTVCAKGCDFTSVAVAESVAGQGDTVVRTNPTPVPMETRTYVMTLVDFNHARGSRKAPAIVRDSTMRNFEEGMSWKLDQVAGTITITAPASYHASLRARFTEVP